MGISHELSEEDVKFRYINDAITSKGWTKDSIFMEQQVKFTDGKISLHGNIVHREKPKFADYVLYVNKATPIAIIEAKDTKHTVSYGLQQAMEYAKMLDVKFAFSSNGEGFAEHDFLTGQERCFGMDEFPTREELIERYKKEINEGNGLNEQEEAVINQPLCSGQNIFPPRYYQLNAINRTINAIAKGQNRILLVMATGTGKTYTAFQIVWRLLKSGLKKKVLYLADRNILVDQSIEQDFKPLEKVIHKIDYSKDKDKLKELLSHQVYFALYQQLIGQNDAKNYRELFPNPDYFDLVIIDECHRGSAKDDSAWRKVLEYFNSATQIGMTATPKADEGANNLDYFGKPIYTYSLVQGIRDGFLAPYRVTNCFIDLDLQGYTPQEDELDIYNNPIEQRFYQQKDYGRDISFLKRRVLVAHRITQMLHEIGRMTKTIVFCTDIDEAEAMRSLLTTMNADLCKKDSRYVMRITGDDAVGKKQLDNFIDVDQPYPTVVTTSELLATGVDCKTCGFIVIDKEIGSMTEFKQIIGRGTRLRPDKGKWHLEILDFRNATKKFRDPEFDGLPEPKITGKKAKPYPPAPQKSETVSEPHVKYIVEGVPYNITTEIVSVLGEDGKTLRTESVRAFTKKQIRKHYATLDDFIHRWSSVDRKKAIVDELKELNVLVEAVREKNPALADADIFDIICHVAYDQPPLTRRERANNVKKRNYFAKYEGKAREVLEALLEKYAENGIMDFEDVNVLDHAPFDAIGKPQKIMKLFGGIANFEKAVKELEDEIYKNVA